MCAFFYFIFFYCCVCVCVWFDLGWRRWWWGAKGGGEREARKTYVDIYIYKPSQKNEYNERKKTAPVVGVALAAVEQELEPGVGLCDLIDRLSD